MLLCLGSDEIMCNVNQRQIKNNRSRSLHWSGNLNACINNMDRFREAVKCYDRLHGLDRKASIIFTDYPCL